MNVCEQLRINPSIFDGFLLPETIHDAFIFFNTEITDSNNIPTHIKLVHRYMLTNPDATDQMLIEECNKRWLSVEIRIQFDRREKRKKMLSDALSNIFKLCIDNFEIYRIIDTEFVNTCKQKIEEIMTWNLNSNCPVLKKARELQELHILHGI
jgi:hypothetical protein